MGYGCTTCIGNSGPLDAPVAQAIEDNDLVVAAVLSGNRNFEGRIHPQVRASYLASPPLVVAYALAGRVDIDLTTEPLGRDRDGAPVFLSDIWPRGEEVRAAIGEAVTPELFRATYASVFEGDERWRALPIPAGDRYAWDPASSYIALPPFFEGLTAEPAPVTDIVGRARAGGAGRLGDHRPHLARGLDPRAGAPPAQWLQAQGVSPLDFNSYGARRGHHEVMMRGTFGNIRLRNALAAKEGPYTTHQPDGEEMFLYDAAMRYQAGRRAAGRPGGHRSTAAAAPGTGPPRAPGCWASAPSSPRATSASIAPTSWAWASCRSSSCPARAPRRWGSPAASRSTSRAWARPGAAPGAGGRGHATAAASGRSGSIVPARRTHRAGLLPPGRHPAGRAAPPRRVA